MKIERFSLCLVAFATIAAGAASAKASTLKGDFNGDGPEDIAVVFNDGGSATVEVRLSTGTGFGAATPWATRQGGFWDAQKWVSGDFNGDGKADLAAVFNDGGSASVDVHLSTGGAFVMQRWETQQGGFWDAQKWLAGDFNGDGKADLANVFNHNRLASIDVHVSSGGGFTMQHWATQQGGFWDAQKWVAGDFDGDGKADLANIFNDGGSASDDVHLSTGSSFGIQRWETRQGGFWNAQKWIAGDFTGDGKADLANVFDDGGNATIDVHVSSGGGFSMQRWATQQGGFWAAQEWVAGRFNRDSPADLTSAFACNDAFCADTHLSNGSAFFTYEHWYTPICRTVTTLLFGGSAACYFSSGYVSTVWVDPSPSSYPNPPTAFDFDPIYWEYNYCMIQNPLPVYGRGTTQECK